MRNPLGRSQKCSVCAKSKKRDLHRRQTVWVLLLIFRLYFGGCTSRHTCQNVDVSKWGCAQAYCESCRTNYAKRHDFHFFFFFIFHLVFFIWHSPWTKNYAEKHNICRNCEQSTTHQCSLKSAIEICQREAHIFLVSNFILSKQVTILRKIDAKTS